MNNEEKILELLSESLQRLDRMDSKIDKLTVEVKDIKTEQQSQKGKLNVIINTLNDHNNVFRGLAEDIQDLKGLKIRVEALERRMDELERYTGKK